MYRKLVINSLVQYMQRKLVTGDAHDMKLTSLVHWLWTIFVIVQFLKYKNHDPDPKSAEIFLAIVTKVRGWSALINTFRIYSTTQIQ